MLKKILFSFLVLGTLVTACKPAKSTTKPKTTTSGIGTKGNPNTGISYQDSDRLSPVLEKAQKEKKPVFMVFHADWCAPCKVMEEEVFTIPQTYQFLNQNFMNYSVDLDTQNGKVIADLYEVSALPTVLFVDPQGVVLEKKIGMAMSSDLDRMGNAALQKMKSK